jgi:hypothetical protein
MSTSNTYSYNPSLGDLTAYAFNLCGIRQTALLQEHMQSAYMAANMVLSRWSADGVNLWQVTLTTVPLVQATETYTIPGNVISILDVYVTVTNGSFTNDTYILPISRTEYASYPNKTQQGFPTTYWFDRLLSPLITLWPVPNGQQTSFSYYSVSQLQDAQFNSGQTVGIQYYFFEAFALALAARLAMMWVPEKAAPLKLMADEAWTIASRQNVENAQQFITPMLQSYWRT